MYYQVFRGDGSSKNYKILSEMLEDFDRQDVEELYRLVKEHLEIIDFCVVHYILLMENGLAIHMLTEKKYPLSQEMLSKMLSRKLEVDHESLQAFELLSYSDEGACVFSDRWRFDELAYGIPLDDPYQTNPPSIKEIISSIRIDREGQVRRIRHKEEIDVLEYQVLTCEIEPTLKPLEEII
ncbi:hypothetical protein Tco_0684915 [Tanacetum coccineum]